MNFLSPDDVVGTTRRKSVCNGVLFTLSNNKNNTLLTPKADRKKERRRGSFNENQGRRTSLVSRWFKHISDAAEQYKPRSKSSHDVAEDPASATLPHSTTKESLETTTDRLSSEPPIADTANVARQSIEEPKLTSSTNDEVIEPAGGLTVTEGNLPDIQENSQKVDNVQTQIRQEDNATLEKSSDATTEVSGKRDSCTIYSNNSNNTRTLTQNCALLDPSEIKISISPAHTAEPVLTNSERLRRLDEKIKRDLLEKERIICDMFRVPHEHFAAIVDVASQPEAPKDTSDIALAAFSHVQSLTEILAQHMKITPEQEISAVSTAVCDRCHQRGQRSISPLHSPPSEETSVPATHNVTSLSEAACDVFEKIIQEDDGYCQIDELRLPSIPHVVATQPVSVTSNNETCASKMTPSTSSESKAIHSNAQVEKSIPNEVAEVKTAQQKAIQSEVSTESVHATGKDELSRPAGDSVHSEDKEKTDTNDSTTSTTKCLVDKHNAQDSKCQHVASANGFGETCGPNRFLHAYSLAPSVPCHAISGIVTALSSQISLLLPKINERDIERERLRRENQTLRELLNSMHVRQRVEEEKETPDNTESAENPPI